MVTADVGVTELQVTKMDQRASPDCVSAPSEGMQQIYLPDAAITHPHGLHLFQIQPQFIDKIQSTTASIMYSCDQCFFLSCTYIFPLEICGFLPSQLKSPGQHIQCESQSQNVQLTKWKISNWETANAENLGLFTHSCGVSGYIKPECVWVTCIFFIVKWYLKKAPLNYNSTN